MELLLDNAPLQIYILHTPGHIQVIESHLLKVLLLIYALKQ